MPEDQPDAYIMFRKLFDGYTAEQIAEFFIEHRYWSEHYSPGAAAARVRACNNPEKPEFWKLSELVAWSQYAGRRALADWVCDQLGLQRPGAADPDGRLARIRQEIDEIEARRAELLAEAAEFMPGTASESKTPEAVPPSVSHARFKRGA